MAVQVQQYPQVASKEHVQVACCTCQVIRELSVPSPKYQSCASSSGTPKPCSSNACTATAIPQLPARPLPKGLESDFYRASLSCMCLMHQLCHACTCTVHACCTKAELTLCSWAIQYRSSAPTASVGGLVGMTAGVAAGPAPFCSAAVGAPAEAAGCCCCWEDFRYGSSIDSRAEKAEAGGRSLTEGWAGWGADPEAPGLRAA